MTDAPIQDQYVVEFLFNDEWQVERGFTLHGDAIEYLNKECAKRFETKPRGAISADFDYRLREFGKVWLEVSFRVKQHGRGPLQ